MIFHISLTTSVIIGLLLLLTPLLKKRYSSQWRYYVWLIIAVRLLIPINIVLPKTIINIPEFEIAIPMMNTSGTLEDEEVEITVPLAEKQKAALPIDEKPYEIPSQTEIAVPSVQKIFTQKPEQTTDFSLAKLLAGIWLSGIIVLILVQAFVYIKFLRKLHFYPRHEIPDNIHEALWQAGKETRISRLPEIRVCGATSSPILTGIFRPVLLLPHDKYSERELFFILRHELVHFRRRDLLYKLIFTVAKLIHWFNPFVWLMTAHADRDVELSCDELVMDGLNDEDRMFYGDAILNTLPIKSKWRLEPVLTTSFGSTKKNMKHRLKNLFDRSLKKKGIAAFFLVLLLTGFISGIVAITPAIAAGNEPLNASSSNAAFSNNDAGASRVMLGPYALKKDESCTITIIWNEGGAQTLQFIKETSEGKESSARTEHQITNRIPLKVTAWEDGNYRFVIPAGKSMTNIICAVDYTGRNDSDKTAEDKEYVSFDRVELRTYDDGSPYIHDIISNHTSRGIIAYERGMLAFDKNGQPLKIKWVPSDSENFPSYYFLFTRGIEYIPSGMTNDVYGGWSLNGGSPYNLDPAPEIVWDIEYILYNLKQITFADGTVWANPDYENWLKTYEGKKISPDTLSKYYPYVMEIHRADIKIDGAGWSENAEPLALYDVDKAAIELMQYSGNWDIVELLIPNMSKEGIDILVEMYNVKNQSYNTKKAGDYYNITGTSADERALIMMQKNGSWEYTSPLFPFMSNEGIEKVVSLYNQKHSDKKSATDFYNKTTSVNETAVINLSNKNTFNIAESGSFQAKNNQILHLDIISSIKGGTVDLFLFDPKGKEQRISISSSNITKEIKLSEGLWQYNCSGIFKDGGTLKIVGTIKISDSISVSDTENTHTPNKIFEQFTLEGIAKTTQNSNTYTFEGVIEADKYQFGNPFPTKKGEQLTFKLNSLEYISVGTMKEDESVLRVVFGEGDFENSRTGFDISPKSLNDIALSMPAYRTANNQIAILNISGKEVKYSFTLTIK